MSIISLNKKIIFKFFFCLVFLFVFTNAFSQCPTVINSTQTFCDTQSPKISNLVASNNGGGVAWFETTISKTPLPSSIFLKDGNTYYADNSAGNCGSRQAVLVKIYGAPIGSPFYVNCVENETDVTVANLTATGNNIKWYNQPTGGIALPSNTVLTDETFYYASQTNPATGCETSRLSTYVNFGVVPIPTGNSSQKFCDDPNNPPTVANLVASGGNIFWYASSTSSQPLPSTTLLVNNQSYYAQTVDLPCKSDALLQVDVTLVPQNDPGENNEKKICVANLSTLPPFDLYNELKGTPDETGVWSGPIPTANGYKGTVNVAGLSLAGSPYIFTYSVASSICAASTATVTIVVTPLPTVTISENKTVCSGENATVTFTGTANATVTYTINGGNSQNVVLNNSGKAIISKPFATTTIYNLVSITSTEIPSCTNPQTGAVTITVIPLPTVVISSDTDVCPNGSATINFKGTPNATVTYTENGGNQTIILNASGDASITKTFAATTIYSLVSIASSGMPSCIQPQNGTVTIKVISLPIVTISGNATICPEGSATITFKGTPNAIVTYKVNNGENQTIVLNASGTASLVNTYAVTTIFSLVSITSATLNCNQPQTGTATITVLPLPTVTISSDASICSGENATVTFKGTPNANVTYKVNGGIDQNIILNALGIATITKIFTESTIYSLVSVASAGTPSCSQPITGTVTIKVVPLPVVSISSDKKNVCPNELTTVTFTGTPDATVLYTINSGSNQTLILDNLGKAEITKNYSETTTYTLLSVTTAGTPGCSQQQIGTITITVVPLPKVVISGSTSICPDGTTTVTFTGTPNATVTYNINGGSEQTIVLDSLGIATITDSYAITTIYTLVNVFTENSNCIEQQTGSVTITVLPLPTVTISTDTTICSGNTATVVFTGTPNAIVTYNINGDSNQTITLDTAGTGVFSAIYTNTTTVNLVSIATSGTPTCSQSQTGKMLISVAQPPIPGKSASLPICSNSNPQDLFLLLGPTAQQGGNWTPAMASGTGIYNPLVDSAGIYTYTLSGTPPCIDVFATVNVSIFPAPSAGTAGTASLCSNGKPIDLFTYIGGSPQTGGVWSPLLASGTNIFDPSIDVAGDYTYTITAVSPCSDAKAIVAVAITPGPNAGKDGKATFCTNSDPKDLFLSLGGKPQIGGTWSPSLASGSGIFNPQVDAPGTYTYFFAGTQPCDSAEARVEVVINPIPDAGQNGAVFFCTNYPAQDLFLSLTGTPQTGGTWSPALASGTGVFNPKVDKAGNYTYSVGGGYCNLATAVIAVSVSQSPNAGGANAKLFIDSCVTSTSVDLTTALNGTQSPGVWTDDDNSGALTNNIFNPSVAGIGTYHFTYTVGGGVSPCLFDTAKVTVVVSPQPNAGTFTGIQNVCSIAGTFDLFNLLTGYQSGGIWTDSAGAVIVNPINVSNLNPSTYTYNYTIKNGCGVDAEPVQLAVFKTPNISGTTLNSGSACLGFSHQVLIENALGLSNGTYIITYTLSGANTITATSNSTIAFGNGSFIIPASQLTNSGDVTVTIDLLIPVASPCGANGSLIVPITFSVISIPTPELQPNGNEFCASDNPTIANLSSNVSGSETVIWYNAAVSGTAYISSDLLQNGMTYYGSYQDNSGCGSTIRLAVTIDLTKCNDIIIPDGFSPNGDGINDAFVIKNVGILFPNFSLEIYNRYGNVVYQGSIKTPNWDGNATAGGLKMGNGGLPVGVYFYVLNYNDGSTKPTQGRVYLSR